MHNAAKNGITSTAVLSPSLGDRWEWVVNATLRPLYPLPLGRAEETGWMAAPVWTGFEEQKILCSRRCSQPEPSSPQPVAILTPLYGVSTYTLRCVASNYEEEWEYMRVQYLDMETVTAVGIWLVNKPAE